jgi:hypothetical protein
MTYTQRLFVLVGASALFMAIYFVFPMTWVMRNISYTVGSVLPFVVVIAGGTTYLARGRRNDEGETVGYVRIVISAVAAALLASFLSYVLLAILAPVLYNMKRH